MTICDLTHAYTPTSGGIRTYIDLKRRYLLKYTEHTHVLIVPGERDRVERGERWTTVEIASPHIPFAAPYRRFTSVSKLVEALRETAPDVVELNTYYMPAEWRAVYAWRDAVRAEGSRVLAAVHYHTDFAHSYVGGYSRKLLGAWGSRQATKLGVRYVRHVLGQADLILTLSPSHVQRLHDFGFAQAAMIPQFVDLGAFHPRHASAELRARFGLGPDDLMLLYCGRLDSEKHVDTLTGALAHLPAQPTAALVMAGEGPKRPELEALAAREPRLKLLPYVSDKSELARMLASADVYVTAGPHEVAAFSVVEAQASGLAVVGVRAGGLIHRVVEGTGYLVDVDDAEAMAARVLDAFRQREAMGVAARAHAEAHYSMEACYGAMLRHYEAARAATS